MDELGGTVSHPRTKFNVFKQRNINKTIDMYLLFMLKPPLLPF